MKLVNFGIHLNGDEIERVDSPEEMQECHELNHTPPKLSTDKDAERLFDALVRAKVHLDDIDLSMVCYCSVCGERLLPDTEAYSDFLTGMVLCSAHAKYNPMTDGYDMIEDD